MPDVDDTDLALEHGGIEPGHLRALVDEAASGGSVVCGAGRPISAEGIFDGSPTPSRNQNSAARPANRISGSAIRKPRRAGGSFRR